MIDREYLLKKFKTKGDLIKYLNDLMDSETEKLDDEMDIDMMNECADWLLELEGIEIEEIPKEEIKRRIKVISDKHFTPIKAKKKRFRFRYVAAVFIFMFVGWLSVETVSVTAFQNNFFDSTAFLSKAIISIFKGNEIEENDTARVASGVREYKTIEKLNKTEKVNIIAPNWLPDDITIENIEYHYEYDEEGQIYIKYDDGITLLTIKLDSAMFKDIDNAQVYEINKIKFYLFYHSNIIIWEYNSNFYSFDCGFDIIEYADKIIENIK